MTKTPPPDSIWLQVKDNEEADFRWDETSWSEDKVFDTDVEYILFKPAPCCHDHLGKDGPPVQWSEEKPHGK